MNRINTLESASEEILSTYYEQTLPFVGLIEELSKRCIVQVLNESNNCKAEAAKRLGMNRTTLVERLRKYGLIEKRLPICKIPLSL